MSYTSDIEFIINELTALNFDFDFTDEIKTKERFNYMVDNLNRDNLISDKTARNVYLSMKCKRLKASIVCGSYTYNLNKLGVIR